MASLFIPPFLDVGAGITPADGALLLFKVVGSGTDKDTYTTATGDVAHANPVVANALGVFPAIYVSGNYDWILQDKATIQKNSGSFSEFVTGSEQTSNLLSRATVAATIADDSLTAGLAIDIAEYTTGKGGGGIWDVVLLSTVTANAKYIVACDPLTTLAIVLRDDRESNVKKHGAMGDWTNDDGPSINSAFTRSQDDRLTYTNTGDGENPGSGSKKPVTFPSGIYETTVPLANSLKYNYLAVRGDTAIVVDTPLRSVANAFTFGYDWTMEGIEIRGFVKQIIIESANVNQSSHFVTNCHFHKAGTSVFSIVDNPQSGMLIIKNVTSTLEDGAQFINMPDSSARIDFFKLSDIWLQPGLNSSGTFAADGSCMVLRGNSAIIDNMTGVPTGTMVSTTPASWLRFYGANLELRHCNFGPELTGGLTALESFAEATESTALKSVVAIKNCRLGTSGDRPQIRLFKLPNVINLSALIDDGVNGGIEYVDATDTDGVAESSGIDLANLKAFAKDGSVMVDSWDYLVSRQATMGLHAGLGYQLIKAAFYDITGVPYKDKIKVDDILCSTEHNQGTKSVGGSDTTGSDTVDYRGVRVRTRTASADAASYSLLWNAFIDYTLIGASSAGDRCAMTLLVEIEYAPAKQGSASFNPSIAQNIKKYPLESGSKTYAVPFVFFNTTNAADTLLDSLSINVKDLSDGDAVSIKRMVILRGFQQTDIEQITAFQEVVTTPSDIANTKFDSNAGWVKGDRVLNHAAATEIPYFICSTEQTGTTVWAAGAVTTT